MTLALLCAALFGAALALAASDDVPPDGSGTAAPQVVVPVPVEPEWSEDMIVQALERYPETARKVLEFLGWTDGVK